MSMMRGRGFSLLEVLIAILIIMLGVLGIAGMQMMAINNTETARYQSRATILAASMAAKMQGNTGYWGAPPTLISITGTAGTTIAGGPAASAVDCASAVCTAPQMAYYDLVNSVNGWGPLIAKSLPPLPTSTASIASIGCSATSPPVCTLTLNWSEKNIALHNPTGTESGLLRSGTAQVHSYQTLVSIQP